MRRKSKSRRIRKSRQKSKRRAKKLHMNGGGGEGIEELNNKLIDAVIQNNLQLAKKLLYMGANPNFRAASGWASNQTPLTISALFGSYPMVKLLLDNVRTNIYTTGIVPGYHGELRADQIARQMNAGNFIIFLPAHITPGPYDQNALVLFEQRTPRLELAHELGRIITFLNMNPRTLDNSLYKLVMDLPPDLQGEIIRIIAGKHPKWRL